jgi:hypothetical protein
MTTLVGGEAGDLMSRVGLGKKLDPTLNTKSRKQLCIKESKFDFMIISHTQLMKFLRLKSWDFASTLGLGIPCEPRPSMSWFQFEQACRAPLPFIWHGQALQKSCVLRHARTIENVKKLSDESPVDLLLSMGDPMVCKSNRFHVDIFRFISSNLRYVPYIPPSEMIGEFPEVLNFNRIFLELNRFVCK